MFGETMYFGTRGRVWQGDDFIVWVKTQNTWEIKIVLQKFLSTVEAIEAAFTVCRDVGDSDPQRMAPTRVAEYVESAFKDSCIKVDIISDPQVHMFHWGLLI